MTKVTGILAPLNEIFEKYQNGIDAKDLAKAYHYSLPGIYSIIRRVRKQKCKRD